MFQVKDRNGDIHTVYAVCGEFFLIYDKEERMWGYIPMEGCRPWGNAE